MSAENGRKTEQSFWEGVHDTRIRPTLPSGLVVATRNLLDLMRQRVRPGDRVIEIGFAPGKLLAHVAKVLGGEVSGIDYSPTGVKASRELFRALGIDGDLRCEDVFNSTFPDGKFDLVYSNGVVEHFDDPREIVRRHVMLARPGGRVLIVVPHYGGLYGRWQRKLDPENLAIHNLSIMSVDGMLALAPRDLVVRADAFPAGRPNPWLLNLHKALPSAAAKAAYLALNAFALVTPSRNGALSPLLALEMVRSEHSADTPPC
jgi:SAM-dependent methyltransferase